jgi:hypothetical protein
MGSAHSLFGTWHIPYRVEIIPSIIHAAAMIEAKTTIPIVKPK